MFGGAEPRGALPRPGSLGARNGDGDGEEELGGEKWLPPSPPRHDGLDPPLPLDGLEDSEV